MGAARHTGPAIRPAPATEGEVVVLSPLQLMSHAVAAALRSRDLDALGMSWVPGVRHAVHGLTGGDVVVLVNDLEDRDSVMAARDLVRQSAALVLILTRCGEGPAWGALLASGAVGLMPVQSSVDDVAAAVSRACRGEAVTTGVRRSHLEREWFEWLAQDTYLRLCAELLPMHEQLVVHRLAGAASHHEPMVPRPRQDGRTHVRH